MTRISVILALLTAVAFNTHATVLLNANFNDKPVDVPIGEGGAEVGEPTKIDDGISAIVRDAPMSSNALELIDMVDYGSRLVRFDFVGLAEVTTGTVTISLDLWFAEADDYNIFIRESQYSSKAFASLSLSNSLNLMHGDADSSGNTVIGTYEIGRSIPVVFDFDMDNGTYDFYFDGELLLADETHGITDAGIGAVLIGINHDSDYLGTVYVDNIYVSDEGLFVDGFESGDTNAWSGVAE